MVQDKSVLVRSTANLDHAVLDGVEKDQALLGVFHIDRRRATPGKIIRNQENILDIEHVNILCTAVLDIVEEDEIQIRTTPDMDALITAARNQIALDPVSGRLLRKVDSVARVVENLIIFDAITGAAANAKTITEARDQTIPHLGSGGSIENEATPAALSRQCMAIAIQNRRAAEPKAVPRATE